MLTPPEPDAEVEREEAWHAALPRCDKLDGSSLTLLPGEATNIPEPEGVAITDGERTAIYAPAVILEVGDPTGPREMIVRAYIEAGLVLRGEPRHHPQGQAAHALSAGADHFQRN